MDLLLRRILPSDHCTIGTLDVDGVFACWTLEDALRLGQMKIAGETAIPAGRYRVIINRSMRFQRMLPRLLDVPNFSGILIHGGNTDQDTSGCILVGQAHVGDRLLRSQLALAALMHTIADALARQQEVWITLVNPLESLITAHAPTASTPETPILPPRV